MSDCIFCKIANKIITSDIVYGDERVIAFNDIAPKAPHHLLIIPRKHIATINDITDEDTALIGYLIQVAKKLAKDLAIDQKGYRILFNCNQQGGQEVYHIHLHLLGGRQLDWPPG